MSLREENLENLKKFWPENAPDISQVPKYISREAKDLLNQLLNKRPDKRITIDKVKQHEFFKGLDWEALYNKQLVPPVMLKNNEGPDPEQNNEEY